MKTWTEIQHHQPSWPYLGLPHRVEAAGVEVATCDVGGQLPGGHLAVEVGDLGDQGVGVPAATEDDGCRVDLGEEESGEDGKVAGIPETNWESMDRDTGREIYWFLVVSLDRAVSIPARVEGPSLLGLPSVPRKHLRGGRGRATAPHEEEPLL